MNESKIAQAYLNKSQNAKRRHVPFTLSLLSFSNLMKAKKCRYTGIVLTDPVKGQKGQKIHPRGSDRTIERIDNTRGYESGNVVAVCNAANQLKNLMLERPCATLKICHFIKMAMVLKG